MMKLASRCLQALVLAVFWLTPLALVAHEARPAYLELKETAPGKFDVLWRTPVLAGMRLPVLLQMPETAVSFVAHLQQRLREVTERLDTSFPDNTELTIDDSGKPHLKRLKAQQPLKNSKPFTPC